MAADGRKEGEETEAGPHVLMMTRSWNNLSNQTCGLIYSTNWDMN